jgi:FAD/FMN-containing dehydrogenase
MSGLRLTERTVTERTLTERRMGRRDVLKGGLAAVATACGVTACGTTRHAAGHPNRSSPTTTGATTGATGGSGPTTSVPQPSAPPSEAEWAAYARTLSGTLVRPGAADYLVDTRLFDFRYDGTRPAGIAYCASPDDVARSLAFARRHGITPTPRAGGHSYAGYSTSSGLVVDVTRMATVRPPGPASTRATIGAGARLIDVYSGLNAAGVSIPAGSCPTVGISGLALGGGIGVVGRRYGLTLDRVSSLQVVTADSRIVTASPTSNEDLYWACRGGGGGNFGVVTAFEMETFPTSDVALFTLVWPWAAVAQVLPAWQQWTPTMPDELWSTCLLEARVGAASPLVVVTGVYLGVAADVAPLLARLTAVAGDADGYPPTASTFSNAMYVESNCAPLSVPECRLPWETPPGGRLTREPSVAKSDLLTAPLTDAAVAIVVDAIDARQSDGRPGGVAYDALGGAIARVGATDTAWSHRDALYGAQYSVPLTAGQPASVVAADEQWLSTMYAALRPYVSGQAYQNYIDPQLADWADAYYGANLARLARIRRRWDPDGTFRFAQAIPLDA